jgi:hypothetical protein
MDATAVGLLVGLVVVAIIAIADIQTQSFDSEIGANSPSSDGLISTDTRMGRGAGLPSRTVPKRACDVRTSICFPGKPETG